MALGMSAKGQEAVEFQGAVTYLLMPDSTLPAAMLQAFPQSMRLTFSGDDVKTEFFFGTQVGSELIYLAKDKRAYAYTRAGSPAFPSRNETTGRWLGN